jgi:hypothetical protein
LHPAHTGSQGQGYLAKGDVFRVQAYSVAYEEGRKPAVFGVTVWHRKTAKLEENSKLLGQRELLKHCEVA